MRQEVRSKQEALDMKCETEEREARQLVHKQRLASREQQETQDGIEYDKIRGQRQNRRVEQETMYTRGQYGELAAKDHRGPKVLPLPRIVCLSELFLRFSHLCALKFCRVSVCFHE